MLNYILLGVILYLFFNLKKSEFFSDSRKKHMANEIFNYRDKLENYQYIKNKLNWLDPVMHADSLELFRSNKISPKTLVRIFD